ncbi:MAG: Gfo/Idh/MocA family oxidoreductase [Oscillospiraceae bacterium]
MPIIKIGSVGIGGISRWVHQPGIEKSSDLELVALCDIDPETLKWAQENYGIDAAHCFTDYRDLIRCPDVDAVDISTSNDAHYEIALAAANAKKPFCLEKPLTLSGEQADLLEKAVEENHVKNMVCFSYRFKAAARYAKELIARGMLGEIYHVDMQYYQAWGLPFCETPRLWRFEKKRTGSGALGDLGSHALDLVRFVTGKEYKRVVSHTGTFIHERKSLAGSWQEPVDVDDFSNYMAEMEGNTAATFRITRFAYGRGNYQTMEIYGSEGALQYELDHAAPDTDEIHICIGRANGEAHVFSKIPVPKEYQADQMQAFADLINGKGDGKAATVSDGQINQHAMDAVLRSAETGTWEKIQ